MYKIFTIVLFVLIGFSNSMNAQNYHVGQVNYTIALERTIYPPSNDLFESLNTLDLYGNPIGVLFSPNQGNDGFTLYDTILIFQPQMAPASINRNAYQEGVTLCSLCGYDGYGYYDEYYDYYYPVENVTIPLHFPTQDTTVGSLKVKVRQNTDISYNLPTNDRIRLYIDNASLTNISWEYSIDGANNFYTIPVSTNSISCDFSAYDIFGDSCINYLGQTIYIRGKYSIDYYNFGYTFITPFTIRLSSPHITTVTPENISCYGEASGKIKLKFDRNLLPNEKINIFLKNEVTQVDYSALNLTTANLSVLTDTSYVFIWLNYPPYYAMVPVPGASSYYYQWMAELPEGNYNISLIGKYNTINTYTGSPQHFSSIQLNQPPVQGFQTNVINNVLCKGGNNGKALVFARGGVGDYKYGIRHENDSAYTWTNFSSLGLGTAVLHKSQEINFLKSGRNYIKIRDANNCILRDTLGSEEIKYFDISQPSQELTVDLLDVSPITSYDSTNGAIKVKIIGGTPFVRDPNENPFLYSHQWRDSATNTIITNYTLDTLGGKYETKISNLPGGTYYFEATDANYDTDTTYNFEGCRIFLKIVIPRPAPLLVNVLQSSPVRCNGSVDGVLKANATGGVPADSLGYQYKWYKFISASYQQLPTTDSILNDVNAGQYKVEVRDRYNNLKVSNVFMVTQPTLLTANASSTQSTCFSDSDGTALATATGGTAPYRYEWSNNDLGPLMDSVPGGNYFVLVIDSLGCEATSQITITSPIDMQANITVVPVKCFNDANGKITVVPSGGTAPYQYTWSNSVTGINNIQNLNAGRYWVTTKDNNNCQRTDTVDLANPVRYTVNAGPDRVVCPSQTIPLKATVLTDSAVTAPPVSYLWTGPTGFNASTLQTVNTLRVGTYYLTVTNASGCAQKDTLIVTSSTSSALTEFIVSTQAYVNESILLANLSNPMPDSVRWQLPAGAVLISSSRSFCEFKLADTGRYNIAIFNYYPSGCIYTKNKNINVTTNNNFVNLGNQANAFLKLFRVYPNPTSGAFTLELVFNGITKARIRMVQTLSNVTIFDQVKEGQYSYTIPYNISGVPATTYIIIIETAKGNFIFKLIKS